MRKGVVGGTGRGKGLTRMVTGVYKTMWGGLYHVGLYLIDCGHPGGLGGVMDVVVCVGDAFGLQVMSWGRLVGGECVGLVMLTKEMVPLSFWLPRLVLAGVRSLEGAGDANVSKGMGWDGQSGGVG